jgi:hypothetical protein
MMSECSSSDFLSIDTTIGRFYKCFQFAAGETPDFDGLQQCFLPGARIFPPSADTDGELTPMTLTEFIEHVKNLFADTAESSANEYQVSAQVHTFQSVAQVFSEYEFVMNDQVFSRGTNCFQLMNDGTRWWIGSLSWDRAPKNQ